MPKRKRRNGRSVHGFADLIWHVYQNNTAVRHLITVLALVLTVVISGVVNHIMTASDISNIVGTQHQISGRIDNLSKDMK